MALAVLYGSSGSRGGGRLAVLTEQNLQPRVHVSPINYRKSVGNQVEAFSQGHNIEISSLCMCGHLADSIHSP